MQNHLWKDVLGFITNRFLIFFVFISVMFYMLVARLFDLQIVNGINPANKKVEVYNPQPISIPAARGNIYDAKGRPLAINQTAFILKMDANMKMNPEAFRRLIEICEKNGDVIVDRFPISKTTPYTFSFSNSGTNEKRWKLDMDFSEESELGLTAEQSFNKLREMFKIDESLSGDEARKILNLCTLLYMNRYHTYDPITLSYNVSRETISIIEEDPLFDGLYVDTGTIRVYPEGKYFSHILGYISRISEEDLAANEDKGYTFSDLFGRSGLERAFESELRGTAGEIVAEVNSLGKLMGYLPEQEDPVPGNNLFLTMDIDLQRFALDTLQAKLKETVLAKLTKKRPKENQLTVKDVLRGLVNGNSISVREIMSSPEGSDSYPVRVYVQDYYEADEELTLPDVADDSGVKEIKKVIVEALEDNRISEKQMILVMLEQGLISQDEGYADAIRGGRIRPLTVLVDKIEQDELLPSQLNVDPCTGSIVVVNVKTGATLAAVGYPSYDNNQFVNNFNNEYWYKLNNDPTTPMYNRPFMEQRAPGSTFKMISAVTVLEKGSVGPNTRIYDGTVFKEAGSPYTRCWSTSSHGHLNVAGALEVSCNFFFCDATYRLGNTKSGNKLQSIGYLNEYMKYFGLNERTGVEIGEKDIKSEDGMLNISTPELKEYVKKLENPDAERFDYEWYDGDTVKTSIGQGYNNYTSANMAKYITVLANRGTRYRMFLVDSVKSYDGTTKRVTEPIVEEQQTTISDRTWAEIYKGMIAVTEGKHGTGRDAFANLPIRVAGKTGTAQENEKRRDHSSFGGFAPYEDPEIAVYVSVPYGDTTYNPALASQIARLIIEEYFGLNAEPVPPEPVNTLVK